MPQMSDLPNNERLAAENWYGYGRWGAPYWFIGPEPGMHKDEGDNLLARCDAWARLGGGELLDVREHHEAFGLTKYFDRTMRMEQPVDGRNMRPPTQNTWKQLIRLLLSYEGKRNDIDAIGDYQCDEWASANGKTCVAELSALAAQSLSTARGDRKTFRTVRAEHLRMRAVENTPRFVVMYDGGQELLPCWKIVACGKPEAECFDAQTVADWGAGFARDGKTVFVRVAHPVNPGGKAPPEAYWDALARELRRLSS
jgi:hypothetical protein